MGGGCERQEDRGGNRQRYKLKTGGWLKSPQSPRRQMLSGDKTPQEEGQPLEQLEQRALDFICKATSSPLSLTPQHSDSFAARVHFKDPYSDSGPT